MNGMDRPDHGGRTVYENAERAAQSVIERAIRHDGLRQPNPEWDVRSEVYAKETGGRVERYMIAGGGPTEWLYFIITEDEAILAFLLYLSAGDEAIVPFGQFDAEDLYRQVKGYRG